MNCALVHVKTFLPNRTRKKMTLSKLQFLNENFCLVTVTKKNYGD